MLAIGRICYPYQKWLITNDGYELLTSQKWFGSYLNINGCTTPCYNDSFNAYGWLMSETKKHWENVYLTKSPLKVSWYQQEPVLSVSLIASAGLAPDAPIIDVGGGSSTLVDKLQDEAYTNISVLDISGSALAHSKIRLADKADKVHWYEADVTRFEAPHRFALWHDRAVFHFLTKKADRERYVNVLKQTLEKGGHIIIMTFATDGPNKCSGLDIVQYDAEKLTVELGPGFKLVETGHEVHHTPAGNQQKFAYFHLRAPEEAV